MKLDWLSNSITKGCLERENNCAFFNENNEPSKQNSAKSIQQPSPLSKKVLNLEFSFPFIIFLFEKLFSFIIPTADVERLADSIFLSKIYWYQLIFKIFENIESITLI